MIPDKFTQRCVQDLAWVIHSPPIISGTLAEVHWWGSDYFQREYKACLPILHQLDTDPTPLQQAIAAAKSQRLGHYFEALVAYWFAISPNYDLLLCNHQLRTTQKTLGELDFLLREPDSGKVIHLEVSVKFYLGTGNLNDLSNWHGPGLQDRLDRKFQHLCTHQTQLALKYPALMPFKVDESACFMKGRLFYPAGVKPGTDFTNANHLFGRWYELPASPDRTMNYASLDKDCWLAEVATKELCKLPDRLNEAVLYAACPNGMESARFFLLPQHFWAQLELPEPSGQKPAPVAGPNPP